MILGAHDASRRICEWIHDTSRVPCSVRDRSRVQACTITSCDRDDTASRHKRQQIVQAHANQDVALNRYRVCKLTCACRPGLQLQEASFKTNCNCMVTCPSFFERANKHASTRRAEGTQHEHGARRNSICTPKLSMLPYSARRFEQMLEVLMPDCTSNT